jgi:RND family efflux transporter MFP subunit
MILAVVAGSSLMLTGCNNPETTLPSIPFRPTVKVETITPGLTRTFSATGDVSALQSTRITSEIRGTVSDVFVKTGDTVRAGDLLLKLNSEVIGSQFNSASSNLNNAKISLLQTKSSAEKSIESAEVALETTRINLENTLKQNRALREQALEAYNGATVSVELGVSTAESNLNNAIAGVLNTVQGAANAADKILGVSETYRYTNDSYENQLGALNSFVKSDAERALETLLQKIRAYTASYENAMDLLSTTESALQKTLDTLSASVTGSNYTETQLTADKNSITSQFTLVRTATSSVDAAKKALDSAKQDTGGNSQALISAKATYEATLSQLDNNEKSARQAVEQALTSLENARQSAQLSKIGAQTSVDAAFGAYDQARITRSKLEIRATFDGSIAEIPVKKGEEVNPGTPLVVLEDDRILKITVHLSGEDVRGVQTGDEVVVNGRNETAVVSTVSPSADVLTKKYAVELLHQSERLRPGELVRVTFTDHRLQNGDRLFIPLTSLHIEPNEVFVWKLDGAVTAKALVTVGDVLNGHIEVLNGLEPGDRIITDGGRLIEDEGVMVNTTDNRVTP